MAPPPNGSKSPGAAQQPFDPRSLYSSASPSTNHAKSPAAATSSLAASTSTSNGSVALKREPSSSAGAADDADSSPGCQLWQEEAIEAAKGQPGLHLLQKVAHDLRRRQTMSEMHQARYWTPVSR